MSEAQEDNRRAEDAPSRATESKEATVTKDAPDPSASQDSLTKADEANPGKPEAAIGGVENREVTATVEAPEEPATIHLTPAATVQPTPPPPVVVATVAVDAVEPPSVSLKAVTVPTPAQPTVAKPKTVTFDQTRTKDDFAGNALQREGEGANEAPKPLPVQGKVFEAQPDNFYRSIFYFSGMGRVIGSALAEGVYVDEKNRRNAIDPDEVTLNRAGQEKSRTGAGGGGGEGELITTARNQANILSAEFRRLQTLLEGIPTFIDNAAAPTSTASRAVRIDEPIHGDIYFRSERPQQQQQPVASSQTMRQTYITDSVSTHHHNGPTINSWSYINNL